jgi:glycosyltransferase involved in cell wall biosynthesis
LYPAAPDPEASGAHLPTPELVARPLVSVVVPTYQRLDLLREAVASVRAQTYAEWELIVVDDGSTDGTLEWLATLGDARIRVLPLRHSGNLGQLRNRGNELARGELIAFLDSDDAFERNKLERQVAALEAHPEAGWSYTAVTRVDAQGHELDDAGIRPWRELSGWILESVLRFDALVATPAVMVRRALLDRVGPLDEALPESQDFELFFRFAAASPAVAISERLTRVRIHAGTLSANRVRVHEAWIQIYERVGAQSSDRGVRRTCADEAFRHRLSAAHRRGASGEPARALSNLLPALKQRPWSLAAWRGLFVGVLARGAWAALNGRTT